MSATFGNVKETALFLGPAERADVIVDFSGVAPGTKVILYNDAPAPMPGFDPRIDYYTGNPDMTGSGGAPSTKKGYGPNTRTIMIFKVKGKKTAPFDLAALQAAWPAVYVKSQPPPIVPQTAYPGAYHAATDTYARISDTQLTFTPVGSTTPVTIPLQPKAIHELFDEYGRMNSILGTERPFTNAFIQTTIPLKYIDPPTEVLNNGVPQIWKITHNGVDTHAIHFHLVNVQLINRVGWDGAIRPPDPNELGLKETIRMNPLEDIIVALQGSYPTGIPFAVPDSIRPLDPTQALGTTLQFTNIDPTTGNPYPPAQRITNVMTNFGWEYVWHCHLLGHEENDMMRPIVLLP
jgi:FtsP/CotA-like multicopper oxidase with cupredoxin domain